MKNKALLFTVVTLSFLASCTMPKKAFDNNKNGWLPENFNPKENILLIEESKPARQQKKIADYMAKHYPYKYEFVSTKDLLPRLIDQSSKTKYGFALINSWLTYKTSRQTTYNNNTTGMHYTTVSAIDYHFVDLANEGKAYPETGIASSYAYTTFSAIIKHILKAKG